MKYVKAPGEHPVDAADFLTYFGYKINHRLRVVALSTNKYRPQN